jgi:hypothetical protein
MANGTPAANSLDVLEDGIIKFTQVGHQTAQSVSQYQVKIDQLTADNHKQGKQALILVDLLGVTGQDPGAIEEGRKRMDGAYDALAVSAHSTAIRAIVNWMVKIAGKEDRIQFFGNNEEALTWLRTFLPKDNV